MQWIENSFNTFGWLRSISLTPVYSITSYGNTIFDLQIFRYTTRAQNKGLVCTSYVTIWR
jgi:hypothetical protein